MIENGRKNEFTPDFVSPPGATLAEVIESLGISQTDLAERTGRSRKIVNEIISGKARILPDTAMQLEKVLGVSSSFWLNMQRGYDEFECRQKEKITAHEIEKWASKFPYSTMCKYKWVERQPKGKRGLGLLRFFGVASPAAWEATYRRVEANFRLSCSFEPDIYSLAAWLREGEVRAQRVECEEFNLQAFRTALDKCRATTVLPPERYQHSLYATCAEAGVIVLFVRDLPKTPSGATRWIRGRALIQLSLRYRTDDQLWFSFFHEAAHVISEHRSLIHISESKIGQIKSKEDIEADKWAADFLIPVKHFRNWLDRADFSETSIKAFARSINIAPGIIVGRCQHDKLIDYKTPLNALKQRLDWVGRQA